MSEVGSARSVGAVGQYVPRSLFGIDRIDLCKVVLGNPGSKGSLVIDLR